MYKDRDDFLQNKEKIQNEARKRFLLYKRKNKLSDMPLQVDEKRMMARRRVIDANDTMALERILGKNDLLPISYLLTGFKVSNSVSRITIRDRVGNNIANGTGFLIAPGIMLTNNHVLPDIDTASFAIAEFNYQNDDQFRLCPVYYFEFEPQKIFITDQELDFTMVAVSDKKCNGKTIADFGFIKLLDDREKIMIGEYVSIIQHPNGGTKSVTLRENEVKYIADKYIHYLTDTQPGSSGSPVFNDQWVAVALHRAGVRAQEQTGKWIANEGVRVSAIANFIKAKYPDMEVKHKEMIAQIFPELGAKKGEREKEVPRQDKGYDPLFLGDDYVVELPRLSPAMQEDAAKSKDGDYILDYVHFSIVMCKSRGLAYFTGVNIDGKTKVHIKRGQDDWRFDSRIEEKYQYGNEVYRKNDLDKGHLVRRTDPNWGEDAMQANQDTFHYTNSAPQHKNLNQKNWLNLEDYILGNAQNHELKISVFTGPVFKDTDKVYRQKYKIPEEFWKVVVMVKADGNLSATAYLQTQEDMLSALEFVYGQYETYQVPLSKIEELTGLDFGVLSNYDPLANVEFSALRISDEKNIRL